MQIEDGIFFEHVVKKIDKIGEDIEGIRNSLSEMKVVSAAQAKDIEMHIKRTDLLELSLKNLKDELEPARRITDFLKTSLQVVGIIALIAGAIGAVLKIFS
jgi:hypothetical protein